MKVKLACLFILAVLPGCGSIALNEISPQPNIAVLGKEGETISLKLNNDVKDFRKYQSGTGCRSIEVAKWRTSLKQGFILGFKNSFKVTESSSENEIEITRAEPILNVTAVTASGSAAACGFAIKYQAKLYKAGKAMKASSGTALAKQQALASEDTLKDAVESMYEKIAKDFYGN